MMRSAICGLLAATLALASGVSLPVVAQPTKLSKVQPGEAAPKVTAPKQFFGFAIGDDYQLATYSQAKAYVEKLDKESDRMVLTSIGKTAEGRDQFMAIITSPENHKKLSRYKEIAARLARAEGLTDAQAKALAKEGKAVVWIDGGLHATEVVGPHQLIETIYQLVSRNDEEIRTILDNVIVLATHANPDGMELVSNWYMRKADPKARSYADIPRLYQKYVGHDNNRDSFMNNMPETTNMSRVLYREWYPQIMYNHHQTGPTGTIIFMPPFRDPFNYVYDPLIPTSLNLVGAAMHTRYAAEGKPGATMLEGANYSTWWNGGLRTTVYFHNMIGLLTEIQGSPTPMQIAFLPDRQIAKATLPYPIPPQKEWHFRQSIDYSLTANWAVLDLAARHKEMFLTNIYTMGKNAIAKGSTDTWTNYPKRIEMVKAAIARDKARLVGEGRERGYEDKYYQMLRAPELRDPRGYIIPANQTDFLTATKFVNTLLKTGVDVHRATKDFAVGGKTYPAGSYVVKTAQAFRPHVLDMFEPQDHPNDFAYPGGPPKPPYDNAGWTLAYQMGIEVDRILDGFDGPFEKIAAELLSPPPGRVSDAQNARGFLIDHRVNDAFVAVNELLAAGNEVYWLKNPVTANSRPFPAGAFYIPAKAGLVPKLEKLAKDVGLTFTGVASQPTGEALKLKPLRIALWDRYGGSMPSGWMRWMFEQFKFPFTVTYAPELDAGNLKDKYDAIVFADGAIPAKEGQVGAEEEVFLGRLPSPEEVPTEWRKTLGRVSIAKTVPQIKAFLEAGGSVIAIGSSTNLAAHLGLPLTNALVEGDKPLPREKFYVPGSILQVKVDNSQPLAHGLPERVDVFFNNSPVYTMASGTLPKGMKTIAVFDSAEPLRSGWAWGQQYLKGGIAIAEAEIGAGKLMLFGPEIANRAQPHGTFKFLFNGLYMSTAQPVALGDSTPAPVASR